MTSVLAGVPSINPSIIRVPRTMSRGGLSLGQPALCVRLQRILRAIGSIQAKPTVSYRNCSYACAYITVYNNCSPQYSTESSDNLPCYDVILQAIISVQMLSAGGEGKGTTFCIFVYTFFAGLISHCKTEVTALPHVTRTTFSMHVNCVR